MLDLSLRPLKERLLVPLTLLVPQSLTPTHLTVLAFLSGILACLSAATNHINLGLTFWSLNRFLDGLDGTLARHRNVASPRGGFLDLLGDFVVYSAIPISCALSGAAGADRLGDTADDRTGRVTMLWLGVRVLEASFHVNNFVLFYAAAVAKDDDGDDAKKKKELTSLTMKPALIEGTESALLFTLMLWMPMHTGILCWVMAMLVCVGIVQRTTWLLAVL